MPEIIAQWSKITDSELLQRSSQVIGAINGQVYIFGGELRPREPRDHDIHLVALNTHTTATNTNSVTTHSPSPSPSPRVGSASTTLNGRLYLFSGRGGVAMAPVEEHGSIWEYNATSSPPAWTMISPASPSRSPYPPARSYHCMTNNGKDTIYLHAGCPENGRLSDLWSFDLTTKQWKELASAPAPARGGPSIAFADNGLLYRMNGFDGNTEQGGSVDIYSPETDTWSSHTFKPDGKEGPEARSVSALLPVRLIDGKKQFLVTLFGERDPSSLGHQGAGKMLGDVWAFDVENRVWMEVRQSGVDGEALPAPRGWFAADVCGEKRIVVQGGLDEANVRLGDVWVLSFA